MIWPVQKTGLPYNIVRFPNGPLLRVPACFRGEWCSGGARKIDYVKYSRKTIKLTYSANCLLC